MAQNDLEKRVATLETYFKIGLTVAAIMGLSGGFIGKTAYDALAAANRAESTAESAEQTVSGARDKAVAAVAEAGNKAVSTAIEAQLPSAMQSRFDALASRIKLTFGSEEFLDYRVMGGSSFDHKCSDGNVAVGWGYGHLHNDARFFCRPVRVSVGP
jgi:hypothetical protein